MLRRLLPVAVCAALLVTGCERKEEKTAVPVRVARPSAATPPGMVPIAADRPLFIAANPLTVGEYVEYLKGTGQDVPAQWQDVLPGSPEAGRAVVGLTRIEALRCATWHMKRLPTVDEWTRAADIVKPRPYPWGDDGQPVSPSAEVFLVQDYSPQSPDDVMKARKGKEGLAAAILGQSAAEVEALAEDLRSEVAAVHLRRELRWQDVKPAFFALLDRERDLAQERAARAGRAEAFDIINKLAAAKARLAIQLKTGDLTTEAADAAVADYGRLLAEARAKAQEARDRLQKALDAAQQQAVELSKAYEEWGASRVDQGLSEVREMIASVGEPKTIPLAGTAKLRLEAAARRMNEVPTAADLPDVEGLQQETAQAEKELKELPADESAAKIAELRGKMATLGESIGHEFLQEGQLFKDLDELVDLRARKEAAEARVKRLQEALPQAPAGAEPTAQ
jgi:hypothetical protein